MDFILVCLGWISCALMAAALLVKLWEIFEDFINFIWDLLE